MQVYIEEDGTAHLRRGDSVDDTAVVIQLKACPKCGTTKFLMLRQNACVYCRWCGISGPTVEGHPEEALSEWNAYIGR